jgi:hypothetical protein
MTQPTKPSLLTRLNLCESWPLWIAGIALLFIVIISHFQAVNPRVCNAESGVIVTYWWMILQCSSYAVGIIIILGILAVILILTVAARAIRRKYPSSYQLSAIFALLLINMWGCYLCGAWTVWTGSEFKHINSLTFGDHTYHLTLKMSYISGIGFPGQYLVYECDSTGQECTLKETVNQNGIPTPYPAALLVDDQQLFIQVDVEQRLIANLSD